MSCWLKSELDSKGTLPGGINSRDLWRVHCGRWSARGNSLGVVNMQNITAVAMCTLFSAFAELEKVVRGLLLLLLLLLSGVRTNEGALAWQKLKTPKGNCALKGEKKVVEYANENATTEAEVATAAGDE